jgi:hypothetical protein
MKKYFTPILTLLASSLALCAQNAVEVKSVDFDSQRDDSIRMEIELACNGNYAPDARNRDYVENIGLRVYLAYVRDASARQYDYYTSEAEVVIMEKGEDYNVYFYLPGLIAERDDLKDDPDFYYVELTVDGEKLSPQKNAMGNIASPEILNSFLSKANSEGSENEHLLMPIYLIYGIDRGDVSDLPVFLRRDVRN